MRKINQRWLSLHVYRNKGHVRTQQEGNNLQARKRGFTRNQPCQHLDLGLWDSRRLRKINFCSLHHPVCGILLQQPKLTNTLAVQLWANHKSSVNLNFFISKMEMVKVLLHKVFGRIKWNKSLKHLACSKYAYVALTIHTPEFLPQYPSLEFQVSSVISCCLPTP